MIMLDSSTIAVLEFNDFEEWTALSNILCLALGRSYCIELYILLIYERKQLMQILHLRTSEILCKTENARNLLEQ